jgi:uncharacterized protein involved in exopolysaccharide biosynthesis
MPPSEELSTPGTPSSVKKLRIGLVLVVSGFAGFGLVLLAQHLRAPVLLAVTSAIIVVVVVAGNVWIVWSIAESLRKRP